MSFKETRRLQYFKASNHYTALELYATERISELGESSRNLVVSEFETRYTESDLIVDSVVSNLAASTAISYSNAHSVYVSKSYGAYDYLHNGLSFGETSLPASVQVSSLANSAYDSNSCTIVPHLSNGLLFDQPSFAATIQAPYLHSTVPLGFLASSAYDSNGYRIDHRSNVLSYDESSLAARIQAPYLNYHVPGSYLATCFESELGEYHKCKSDPLSVAGYEYFNTFNTHRLFKKQLDELLFLDRREKLLDHIFICSDDYLDFSWRQLLKEKIENRKVIIFKDVIRKVEKIRAILNKVARIYIDLRKRFRKNVGHQVTHAKTGDDESILDTTTYLIRQVFKIKMTWKRRNSLKYAINIT